MPLAVVTLILMIALPTLGLVPLEVTAAVAVMVMVFGHILPAQNLLRQVDWNVIAVIAASFGISAALEQSGASQIIAERLIGLASGWGAMGVLLAVYLLTNCFTEVITNNAAAALVFPIAYNAATLLHANPRPFMLVIAMAASASFATPIGYQTNMMVYGPGGYRYRDFLRIGLPLNLLYGSVTLFMAWFWWFRAS
jgi:di/tricarboxylate transporter